MARATAFTVGTLGATDLAKAVAEQVGVGVLGVELSLSGPAAVYVTMAGEELGAPVDRTLKDGEIVLVVNPDVGEPGVFILDSLEIR